MRKNMGVYRGKMEDGEWVEGFLCFHYVDGKNENGFVYTGKSEIYDQKNVKNCDVITETVGQWTGREGIYENDYVKAFDNLNGGEFDGVVKYDNCSFYIDDGICHHYRWTDYDVKVIGNIHDNPKLVKE